MEHPLFRMEVTILEGGGYRVTVWETLRVFKDGRREARVVCAGDARLHPIREDEDTVPMWPERQEEYPP